MEINRALTHKISEKILDGEKIVVLYGPRQSGKTTLAREVLKQLDLKTLEALWISL